MHPSNAARQPVHLPSNANQPANQPTSGSNSPPTKQPSNQSLLSFSLDPRPSCLLFCGLHVVFPSSSAYPAEALSLMLLVFLNIIRSFEPKQQQQQRIMYYIFYAQYIGAPFAGMTRWVRHRGADAAPTANLQLLEIPKLPSDLNFTLHESSALRTA